MKRTGTTNEQERVTFIYDGSCTLCMGTARWIRENEIEDSFEMLPCQAEEMTSRFPVIEHEACMKAMHLVLPDGTVLVGEQAAAEIFARLRHYRFVAVLFKLPGVQALSRTAYQWFAARRYKIAAILSHIMGSAKKI
jgi:predicted DCC family thiol-disulfide oxidoreductase YuxK